MTWRKPTFGMKRPFPRILKYFLYLLVFLLLIFVLLASPVAVGSLILLNIDKYHDNCQNFIIRNFLNGNNYYDGTTWFSVSATLVGAVISATPGLICGLFALLQTWRLHKLETRYHHPALETETVELSFAEMDRIYRNGNYFVQDFRARQRYGVIEAKEQKFSWWVDLNAELSLNNDVSLRHIEIESVTFSFPYTDPKREYKLSLSKPRTNTVEIRSFKRTIKDRKTVYVLSYCLNPFILESPAKEDDFNSVIRRFVYYNENQHPDHLHLELSVSMNISYDYTDQKTKKGLLKVLFEADATDNKEVSKPQNIIKKQSANGYVTYEV